MNRHIILIAALFISICVSSFAQGGWTICNPSGFGGRIDDLFMVNTQIGYAVCGDGQILKTLDGGDNWVSLDTNLVYHRSVEFINTQKGFVGSFSTTPSNNILMKTIDGGSSWTDLTSLIDTSARGGICGLAIPDSNTIYGCGNYYQDSAYIVKSIDGGNSWSFIDMHTYATHLIDMYFLNKDTGFATGSGLAPLRSAVILYTTDGGLTWTYKFQNTIATEWCWKIYHLSDQIYFASIEDWSGSVSRILKSIDGGMTWSIIIVPYLASGNGIQGIGFIDSLKGWTGGGFNPCIETDDGGVTWYPTVICPSLNRVFKVNDTLLFASGDLIWKYSITSTGVAQVIPGTRPSATLKCFPNPTDKNLKIEIKLPGPTHVLLLLLDEIGRQVENIESTDKPKGEFQYQLNTDHLSQGVYHIILKTHEDQETVKVIVRH